MLATWLGLGSDGHLCFRCQSAAFCSSLRAWFQVCSPYIHFEASLKGQRLSREVSFPSGSQEHRSASLTRQAQVSLCLPHVYYYPMGQASIVGQGSVSPHIYWKAKRVNISFKTVSKFSRRNKQTDVAKGIAGGTKAEYLNQCNQRRHPGGGESSAEHLEFQEVSWLKIQDGVVCSRQTELPI